PYFGEECAAQLVAVAWLGRERDYARGPVDAAFMEKLASLLENVWQPVRFRGRHSCELSRADHRRCNAESGNPSPDDPGNPSSHNLFVPGEGFLYVAPAMIGHYIRVHN